MTQPSVFLEPLGLELRGLLIEATFGDDQWGVEVRAHMPKFLALRDIRDQPVRAGSTEFRCSGAQRVRITVDELTVSVPIEVIDELVRQVDELNSRWSQRRSPPSRA